MISVINDYTVLKLSVGYLDTHLGVVIDLYPFYICNGTGYLNQTDDGFFCHDSLTENKHDILYRFCGRYFLHIIKAKVT